MVLPLAFAACGDDEDDDAALTAEGESEMVDDTTTTVDDNEDPGVDNTTPSQGLIELRAELAGATGGDPDGSGTAKVRVDVNNREICYTIDTENLGDVTGSHIAEQPAQGETAIVVPLSSGKPLEGTVLEGCAREVDRPLATTISANPGRYEVHVVTAEHPDGAIRGTLELAD